MDTMDIRSQRTKQVISESFLELLKGKPASRITVTEICSMASINRATFYKHYLDVPDLQVSLENEILSDFTSFLQNCCFSDTVLPRWQESKPQIYSPVLTGNEKTSFPLSGKQTEN